MESFETIYTQYFPRVYSFIYRLCSDEGLAEELTQETFYQAFRSFKKYRGESELFTWLASIAKYTFFGYVRKKRRSAEIVDLELIADTLADDENDPEEHVGRSETIAALRQAIDEMPDKYRDVVILRLYAELPFSEIAESLGITENSAKVIFHRAKKQLSEKLGVEQ